MDSPRGIGLRQPAVLTNSGGSIVIGGGDFSSERQAAAATPPGGRETRAPAACAVMVGRRHLGRLGRVERPAIGPGRRDYEAPLLANVNQSFGQGGVPPFGIYSPHCDP